MPYSSGEEILVEHFRLVVAAFALLDLLHEAFALVNRVVQFGIGVAHLAAADEELEPFGQARVFWAALGQRADLDRVHRDKGRLHQMLLDLLVEAGVKRVAPRLFGGLRQFDADRFRRRNSLRVVGDRAEIDADILLDGIYHRQPRPAGVRSIVSPIQFSS